MNSTLYILNFNNYYNRIIKKFSNIEDYLIEPFYSGLHLDGTSFNPNDGITTEHVINNGLASFTGDYLLNVQEGEIISRWFIIEAKRNKIGQYTLTLRRDVVADSYDQILTARMFVEKAMLPIDNPLIFNNENMTTNQIKQSEHMLKDETGCGWIVGYIPRDFAGGEIKATANDLATNADITVTNLSDWTYYSYLNQIRNAIKNIIYKISIDVYTETDIFGNKSWYASLFNMNDATTLTEYVEGAGSYSAQNNYRYESFWISSWNGANFGTKVAKGLYTGFDMDAIRAVIKSEYYSTYDTNPSTLYTLKNLDGKIIHETSTGKYYQVKYAQTQIDIDNKQILASSSTASAINSNVNKHVAINGNAVYNLLGTPNDDQIHLDISTLQGGITTVDVTTEIKATLPASASRVHLTDSPYDMFCIPFSDELTIFNNGLSTIDVRHTSKSIAINIAQAIAVSLGSEAIYDIQLLPYCPVRNVIKFGTAPVTGDTGYYVDKKFCITTPIVSVNGTEDTIGEIFWADKSIFSIDIPSAGYSRLNASIIASRKVLVQTTDDSYDSVLALGESALEVKIKSQVDLIRLCSPNYSNFFDFNTQKNYGCSLFNIDIQYKPYSPYIHVNPDFKGLYGEDFNDSRGLICGGDYSLAQITSAWANYQLQNKNYQAIFDRGTQNIQVNNAIQRQQEIVQVAAGAVSAGVGAGVGAGALIGGPAGIAAGVVMGGASAAAGIADIVNNEKLRTEALDYRKDLFGYQLGNIQALPNGLSKTSAFTPNNKIFPFIEYYTCMDEERDALEQKIIYNGMTVMRIGSIQDFIQSQPTYIKGQLFRLEYIGEDFHYISELGNELNKGVYI